MIDWRREIMTGILEGVVLVAGFAIGFAALWLAGTR